jgi:hypothetical protein
MDPGPDVVAAEPLLRDRAQREWLRGDLLQIVAVVGQVDTGRYRVRGLDANGLTWRLSDTVIDTVAGAFDDTPSDRGLHTVVRGRDPRCAAVGLYRAAAYEYAWLAITPSRLAVLRLRDIQNTAEDQLVGGMPTDPQDRQSLGQLVRGVSRLVKATATELARSMRRAPLAERPQDAVLECPFEVPRAALQSITPWKPRLMPAFRRGPRWVEVHFADDSRACLTTDAAGAAALTAGPQDA